MVKKSTIGVKWTLTAVFVLVFSIIPNHHLQYAVPENIPQTKMVCFSGTDYEIGLQKAKVYLDDLKKWQGISEKLFTGENGPALKAAYQRCAASMMERSGALLNEYRGMADGARMKMEDIVIAHLGEESLWKAAGLPVPKECIAGRSREPACSVFAMTTSDRGPLVGNNGDSSPPAPGSIYYIEKLNYAGSYRIIRCKGAGVNETGLAIGTANAHYVGKTGIGDGPSDGLSMETLRRCADVNSAIDYIRNYRITDDGEHLVLVDISGDAAAIEKGPSTICRVRQPGIGGNPAGVVWVTNVSPDSDMRDLWDWANYGSDYVKNSDDRYANLRNILTAPGFQFTFASAESTVFNHTAVGGICQHGDLYPGQAYTTRTRMMLPDEARLLLAARIDPAAAEWRPCHLGWIAQGVLVPSPIIRIEQNAIYIPENTGTYDFGLVMPPSSKSVTFAVKNLGDENLVLTASPPVSITGANAGDFSVSVQPSTSITPGQSVTFEITFRPTQEGVRTATVSIPSNDSDRNPYTFTVKGSNLPPTIYVDADAAGLNNGSSWADAYNYLQNALAAAQNGYRICVAKGVYKPDRGQGVTLGNRSATFQLKKGVAIMGGYAGFGEPDPDERNIQTNQTILSGDIGTIGSNTDNSYHVVTGSGTNNTAVLDGFTITAGNANGSSSSNFNGGGIYNSAGSPTISNCLITNNSAYSTTTRPWPSFLGGGMYNYQNSSPTVTNCTFSANNSCAGGGIANFGGCNPVLNNCTFSANSIQRSNPSSERGYGGAMFNGNSNPVMKSCIFTGNSSSDNAGGIWNSGSNPTITNCTFVANSALWGGGIVNFNQSNQELTNCIFWGNRDQSGTGQLAQIRDSSATSVVSYCCVQGWSSGGTGNINNNPSLAPDNYHLTANSPCINAGTNTPTGGLPDTDIDNQPRIIGGQVDMGADEFNHIPIADAGPDQTVYAGPDCAA